MRFLVLQLTLQMESWSNSWQKFHLPLTYICRLQLMLLPHPESVCHYPDLNNSLHVLFCLVLQTLTSPNFNMFRIDWSALWQSHLQLLAVFNRFVPLHWLPVKFRIVFKIRLQTCKTSWKTACLSSLHSCHITPHHSHPIHWDQTKEALRWSLGSRPMQVQEHFTLVALLFGTTSDHLSAQPFYLLLSRNISRHIPLTGPFPIDHGTPDGPLIRNCIIDFAVEHQIGCYTMEPGVAGDIGPIEM